MRLPCPVGHYGLLSILGGSARPPSLLTPPLCGQTWHPATSIQYRVVTETVLRALRDLRAPWWPGMPSLASCVTHPPARDASRLYILLGSRSLRFFRCFA